MAWRQNMNAADGLRKPRPDTFVESVEGGVAMSEKQRSAGTVLGAVALLIVTGCDDGIGPAGSANLATGASWPFNASGFYDIPPDEFNRVTGYEVFADDFMLGDNSSYDRRPVDLLVLPDGSLLVIDEATQEIYRIWYGG